MAESIQHKLDRVRPPRVQITYDVETGGALQKKELPYVVGVLADLAGDLDPDVTPVPLKARKFVEIDRDNFDKVMESVGPRVAMQVDNRLTEEDTKFNVVLNFSKMEDLDPAAIVNQVEPLRKLYEARQRLSDLRSKLDGNDDLDRLLQEIVENTDGLKEVQHLAAAGEAEEE
jgi:type VI secretion system protein ImpB